MTPKEHFKAMYHAMRLNLHINIAHAAICASDEYGRIFAIDITIAARRANDSQKGHLLMERGQYGKFSHKISRTDERPTTARM